MDMLLDENGDLVFINGTTPVTTTRPDAIAQRLKVKLLTFLGEWFLNTEYGIPYFQEIFDKQRSKSTVDTIFQEKILEEDGVLRILSFESQLDPYTRTYNMKFIFQVDGGESAEVEINTTV